MPAISVIIPVYGVEKYLADCLDSVLASTLEDIEVICVDDCSPDRCPQILDEYATRDQRIQVIHLEKNGGQGIARNVGFERSCGEYVYFLDSDDMIVPDALERVYARAKANDLDGVFFDSQNIFESPDLVKRNVSYLGVRSGTYREGVYTGIDLFKEFDEQCEWTCMVQRQLWRRQFLVDEDILFPEAYSHEDEFFAFKATLLAKRVAYMREPFFIRRFRAGSVMTTPPTARGFYSYLDCYVRMFEFLDEHGIDDKVVKRQPARIYNHLCRFYDVIGESEDLLSWCKTPETRAAFALFMGSREEGLHRGNLGPNAVHAADETEHLFLYGAGVVGANSCRYLAAHGAPIYGIFVTSAKGNPRALMGHPIIEFSPDFPLPNDALVLVTVTEGFREEIEDTLDKAGVRHMYYRA